MEEKIRVALIHPNRISRDALAWTLSQQHTITVVGGMAASMQSLPELKALRPDIIVVDFSLLRPSRLQEVRQIHRVVPHARLLIIGLTPRESDVLPCIEAGAVGFLPLDASLEDLLTNMQGTRSRGASWCVNAPAPL